MDILFMKPVFKDAIWGGTKLRTDYGYDVAGDTIGECWAISAHPQGDCEIANGEFKGKKLSWLWDNKKDIFNNREEEVFPLLTKIIDAKQDLSIQVHPDDDYAKVHENGSLGKTECWYVLDCDEGTEIVIGHNAKTKEELISMIDNQEWTKLIRKVPVHKGDFFQIDPGTVHAIKGGTVILETQQSSDITYRVYDYDRLSNGKKRELHIDKSKDVIKVPYEAKNDVVYAKDIDNSWLDTMVECKFYTVWHGYVDGKAELVQNRDFMLVSVVEGSGTIDGISISKGSHFIIPYGYNKAKLEGNMELICSALPVH
ncbi:MAG: mannose-6-phosphate isomerase, class I [Coprococcus sp.]